MRGFVVFSLSAIVVLKKFRNKYRIESNRAPFWNYGWSATYFITICTQYRIHWFGYVKDGRMILSEMGKIAESQWLKTFEMRPDMNLTMGEFVVMPNHFHAIIGIGKNPFNCGRGDAMSPYCRDAMHCVSTDGHCVSAVGHCDPIIGHCDPVIGHFHPTTDHFDPNTDHFDPTTDHFHPTTDHCDPTIGQNDPQSTHCPQTDDQNTSKENRKSSPKNKFGPQSKNLGSIIRGFKSGVTKHARMINADFAWQTRYNDHIIRNEKGFRKISQYIKDNPSNWRE